jgi:hypothetical protein
MSHDVRFSFPSWPDSGPFIFPAHPEALYLRIFAASLVANRHCMRLYFRPMARARRPLDARIGYRQEVFNVLLAQLLRERGVISAPEDVISSAEGRRMPDVLVDFAGLRTAVEGEVDDQPNAGEKAIGSAHGRVEQGIAQIGLAIIYPSNLRRESFTDLKEELAGSDLQVAVVTEAGPTGFATSNVDGLADILRRTLDQLVQENTVAQAVAALEAGIESFATAACRVPAIVPRMAEALGNGELPHSPERSGSRRRDTDDED